MYTPLYPPDGGPCRGFVCDCALGLSPGGKPLVCGAVTKTRRGIVLHLQLKHRIVLQEKLPLKPETSEVPA